MFGIVARLGLQMLIIKMPINYGWKVRVRMNIWRFHVKTNKVNIVSVFNIHKITRHPL